MQQPRRILVAGIGNIFLGDDGFGVEVARRLSAQALPDGVRVADFGIRGVHLAYELAGGAYDEAILVDAAARGEPPGTLSVIEPEIVAAMEADPAAAADAHHLTPAAVLAWLRRIGGGPPVVTLVACEPASLDEGMTLSAPVAAVVDDAVGMVQALVSRRERSAASCA